MAYETLIVEIEDHVALIRLNRPDALNALNSAADARTGRRADRRPMPTTRCAASS